MNLERFMKALSVILSSRTGAEVVVSAETSLQVGRNTRA